MIIYKITNLINNKIYIGKTQTSFRRRYSCYKSDVKSGRHKNIYLYKAFEKYGFENFKFDIIVTEISSENELNYCEKYLIAFYNSNKKNIGYNSTSGGDGARMFGVDNPNFGKKNLKLSEFNKSRKGKRLSEQHKKNIGLSGLGRVLSESTIDKMKMVKRTDEEKKNISRKNSKKIYCDGKEFMSRTELAQHLNVCISAISNAIKRGSLVSGHIIQT